MQQKRKKAVIIDDRYESHEIEREELSRVGAEMYELTQSDPTPQDILSACEDADAILVNLAKLSSDIIGGLKNCRVIARYGVGYDNVDVEAATANGIIFVNVTDYCTEEVSDHALALFLACVRQIRHRDASVRNAEWDNMEWGPIGRIAGRTFGLVGFGHIPRVLNRKLKGFNLARVLISDPFVSEEQAKEAGAQKVDFETLLEESDYISIHAPLTAETRHMFGAAEFRKMKPTSVLINTARGGLVDTEALTKALISGEIGWAGIDVHEQEPVPKDYPLAALGNVVLSDHIGFHSAESQAELQRKAARYAAQALDGETPKTVVNRKVLDSL